MPFRRKKLDDALLTGASGFRCSSLPAMVGAPLESAIIGVCCVEMQLCPHPQIADELGRVTIYAYFTLGLHLAVTVDMEGTCGHGVETY